MSTEIATKEQKAVSTTNQRIVTVRDTIFRYKSQIAQALPKHLDADRLLRISINCITKNEKLLNCTQASLIACVIQCGQLGLEPDTVLGEAYLVPYKETATFIAGYQGLMKLARQDGRIQFDPPQVVRTGDTFAYSFGLNRTLRHVPGEGNDDQPMTHVYAVARIRGSEPQFVVLTRAQVEKFRARSMAKDNGPWVIDYEAMAKKTAVRQLCKALPRSPALARAVALDEHAELSIDGPQPFDPSAVIDIAEVSAPAATAGAPDGTRMPLGKKAADAGSSDA